MKKRPTPWTIIDYKNKRYVIVDYPNDKVVYIAQWDNPISIYSIARVMKAGKIKNIMKAPIKLVDVADVVMPY